MRSWHGLVLAVVVASAPFLVWAGGAIHFDGDDYYVCDTAVDFDEDLDDVSILAWVTPDFASSDTSTQVILAKAALENCPTLPPFCTGVTCGTGYALFWDGANTRFEAWMGEFERCGTGINTYIKCRMSSVSFSAGDLIGIYASFRDEIAACQAFIPAGTGALGSAFFPHEILNASGTDLHIGAANPEFNDGENVGAFWNGNIDMIVLADGRVANLDNNRLSNLHKRSWHPMWQGTFDLNGTGGGSPSTPFLVADMMQEHPGDSVSTLRPVVGFTCSSGGDPVADFTRMLY